MKGKTSLELIGNTPMVALRNIWKGKGNLYAKLESVNPGGSIKDRAALEIIKYAYSKGFLKKGQTVVEMTSGNMGAGLAVVCNMMGNPFIAVMPKGNSPERKVMLEGFGAKVVLIDQVDGTPGNVTGADVKKADEEARKLAKDLKAYYVDQFNNPGSVLGHLNSTGPEIYNDLKGKVDVFVAAVGSGGTFVGASTYLKGKSPSIKCIAVEPEKAAILSGKKIEDPKHIMQGIGYGLIPPHWNPSLCDWVETVSNEEVRDFKQRLAKEEGLYVGFSAAANVCAAIKVLKKLDDNINVVTVLCDHGLKYPAL